MLEIRTFVCNMLHVNCYVVYDKDSREAAVIDPGFYWENEKQTFVKYIEANQLKIKYLLCTHLHFDHIFGVAYIEDTFNVKLSASLLDTPWIENFQSSIARFGIRSNGETRPVTYPLRDGDILMLGTHTLECISTPGHSAGGMCFYAKDNGYLFAGDTLFQSSIGRTDFADGDYAQLIRSIQTRLMSLPAETIVFSGHGDSTTIGDEKMYNPYI